MDDFRQVRRLINPNMMQQGGKKKRKLSHDDEFLTVSALINILISKSKASGNKKELKEFFEQVRSKQPRLFYKAVQVVTKMKKPGVRVVAFRNEDGTIRQPMEYVEHHFNNKDMPITASQQRPADKTTIST